MKKPFKIAGICGIIMLVIGLIVGIVSMIISLIPILDNPSLESMDTAEYYDLTFENTKPVYLINAIATFVVLPFLVLFIYGFVVLGKRFKNKLLMTVAWIFIVSFVLASLMTLVSVLTGDIYPDVNALKELATMENYNELNFFSILSESMKLGMKQNPVFAPVFYLIGESDILFWLFLILIIIGTFLLYLLLGIGIIKLKKSQVPLAIPLGIFAILSPFWGLFDLTFRIMAIVMFFKLSKKFETKLKKK